MVYAKWHNLKLNPSEIYRSMGRTSENKDWQETMPSIEHVRLTALKLAVPRFVGVVLPVTATPKGRIKLAGNLPFHCNQRYFFGASHAVALIVTVGSRLEQESDRCFREGKYLEGLIFDACGSVALDEVLGLARQKISQEMVEPGQKLGYTLSPGCQMIPLEEQATIFSLLDFEAIGVTLTDAYMMIPGKSLSAIIPVGTELSLPNDANYACEVCSRKKECEYKPEKARN